MNKVLSYWSGREYRIENVFLHAIKSDIIPKGDQDKARGVGNQLDQCNFILVRFDTKPAGWFKMLKNALI